MPPKKPPTPLIEPGEGTVHEHHGKSGCDGNSITVTRAIEAAIEHRLLGPIPGTRELVLFLAEHKPFCNPLLSRILLSTPESSAASHKCRFRVRRFGRVFALPYKRPLTSSRCSTRSAAHQCSAVQRNAAQCSAVQRSAAQCSAVQLDWIWRAVVKNEGCSFQWPSPGPIAEFGARSKVGCCANCYVPCSCALHCMLSACHLGG